MAHKIWGTHKKNYGYPLIICMRWSGLPHIIRCQTTQIQTVRVRTSAVIVLWWMMDDVRNRAEVTFPTLQQSILFDSFPYSRELHTRKDKLHQQRVWLNQSHRKFWEISLYSLNFLSESKMRSTIELILVISVLGVANGEIFLLW